MSKDTKTKRPTLGRPPLSPEERMSVSAIRLKPKQWETFYSLGGADWLRKRLDRLDRARG